MLKKVSIVLIAMLILASFFVVGCKGKDPKQDTKETKKPEIMKIGVIAPLTGDGATYGDAMRRGFELAFEDETGFQLIYEDSKLSAKDGVSAINKLISSDKVQVVLGAAASSVSLAMAPIAERNKVILFSSISTSDDLRKSGEYFFRNVPRNEVQGITAAEYLYNTLSKKKVVVFKKNDEYATNLSKSFKQRYIALGGEILLDDAYQPETRDFKSIITKIKGLNPPAVYIPGNYQETALFLKQAYEAGLNSTFIGGDGSYSPELISIAGNAAEGSMYTIMAVEKNDYYNSFKDRFVKKYSREPDVYDAYAFEAAEIIIKAIKNTSYDASKIKKYLLSNYFDSLTGQLTFDVDGEVDRNYGIVKVVGGEFNEV